MRYTHKYDFPGTISMIKITKNNDTTNPTTQQDSNGP